MTKRSYKNRSPRNSSIKYQRMRSPYTTRVANQRRSPLRQPFQQSSPLKQQQSLLRQQRSPLPQASPSKQEPRRSRLRRYAGYVGKGLFGAGIAGGTGMYFNQRNKLNSEIKFRNELLQKLENAIKNLEKEKKDVKVLEKQLQDEKTKLQTLAQQVAPEYDYSQ